MEPRTDSRISVDVETAAELLGISRAALYPLVMAGDVPSFKVGRRRLVPVDALRGWVAARTDGDADDADERLDSP